MKILAIDPGNTLSAWCLVEDGKPREFGKLLNGELLGKLRAEPKDQLLAIEMIASYGMAVGREVFDTCVWIGRFAEAWGLEYRLVYRKDVKLFHCQSMRATDANIRAAIIDRFGPGKEKAVGTKAAPGPLYGIKGDEWSALAVGLTVHGADAANALNAMESARTPHAPQPRVW